MMPWRMTRTARTIGCARKWATLVLLLGMAQPAVADPNLVKIEPPMPDRLLKAVVDLDPVDVATEELPQGAAGVAPYHVTRTEVEQLVLTRHPRVREAMAAEDASRGNWLQVGLPPNPTVGYVGNEIGNDGRAGQQGAYFGQTFVRGGKLDLNRAVASHRIVMSQQGIVLAQQRVLTDARLAFYDLLILQRRIDILQRLLDLTKQAETTAEQLFQARESPKTDYLQALVELNRMQLDFRNSHVELRRAQEVLAARIMFDSSALLVAEGSPDDRLEDVSWQEIESQVLATHPAIVRALADVRRARCQVSREQVEVVPNLMAQASVQYDDATQDTVASVQAGVSLPVWNRNQGAISAAWSELRAAEQRVSQTRLDLQAELAGYLSEVTTAQQKAQTYEREILPQANETQRLIAEAYRQGEVGFLNYLTAQRTYFEANLGYLDALQEYWTGHAKTQGMLPPTTGF